MKVLLFSWIFRHSVCYSFVDNAKFSLSWKRFNNGPFDVIIYSPEGEEGGGGGRGRREGEEGGGREG